MKKDEDPEQIHQAILEEVLAEDKTLKKETSHYFFLLIGSLMLMLLLVIMVIPYWKIAIFPHPETIPSLPALNMSFLSYNKTQQHDLQDVSLLISPTPSMRTIAEMILAKACPQQGQHCGAQALYYFVRDNIHYLPDPLDYEYIKEPSATLLTGKGDCDDHAVLVAALMRSIGIPTELVVVPHHMMVKIYLPEAPGWLKQKDGWIYLDPTCKSCDFGEIAGKWKSFLFS